jgi:two-component system CheB/CheR fusion protein
MSNNANDKNDTKTNVDSTSPQSLNSEKQTLQEPCDFHIVGVGASAGGLEAIEKLFAAMPNDTGAAFVVVQHLSPDFKSHMEELLARKTSLAIKRVTNQMQVEPDTIYLIPPNTEMVIANGQLLLTERDRTESLSLPIDHFLRSLANDRGKQAIGIILSGTGSDGSRGIGEINEAGGLILCQDENTAKFDGMPLSAQETNSVHLVLPPEQMAHALSTYISNSLTPELLAEQELVETSDTGIDEIFKLLRRDHNIDFSLYKPTTVKRRIERRISLGHYSDLEKYAIALGDDPEELNSLYKDLLIGVTQFFRDRQAFDVLKQDVIPEIIEKKRESNEAIRVWIAGCATGEEAYSIAISFHEAFENEKHPPNIKIFATDVHRKSLHFASLGIYPESSFGEISPERLEKYFNKRIDGYEIIPAIRKMIVFAPHDLANDAPFTKLDLVTCRNLLIYFQPVVQKKVISLFHFALRTGSYMFLGPSETPGDLLDEFEVQNKKWRVYKKRRDVRLTTNIKLPIGGTTMVRPFSKAGLPTRPTPESQMLATYDMLLDKCMSPSFLVDERGELIHSFGGAERFLQFRGGRVSTNIVEVIHEDLKTSVSGALQHSAKEQKVVRYTGIHVKTTRGIEHVRLVVDPFRDPRTEITHTLVTIEPIANADMVDAPIPDQDVDVSQLSRDHISTLENELRYTKENLQATVEELETSNEELQATNEELVASNEEMQSTNEELQSVNEELYTVNHEYQRKIGELTELTDDMNNLFLSTEVGVVFLDEKLNIRRFTPKIAETFNLLAQDVGRPIRNFTHNIRDEDVFDELTNVLNTEKPFEREVRDQRGNNWLLRIAPYRTKVRVEGVVLTLVDTNSIKESDAKLKRYRDIVESTVEAIIETDKVGQILSWNRGAEKLYGYTKDEAIGKHVSMLTPDSKRAEAKELLQSVASGEAITGHQTTRLRKDGELLHIGLAVSPVYDGSGELKGLASISHDYTQRKKAEEEQKKLATIIETTSDFVGICDAGGKTLSINSAGRNMLGIPLDEDILGTSIDAWHSAEQAKLIRETAIPAVMKDGEWRGVTIVSHRDGGREIPLSSVILAHKDDEGKVAYMSKVGRDITHRKEAEDKLSRARDVAEAANNAKSAFVANMSHEIRTPLTTVVGMTEMLLEHETDKAKHDTMQMIHQSGKHLVTLVNDILDMSKIEAGKLEADPVQVAPTQIIEDVAASMRYRANEKGLDFTLEFDGMLPEVMDTDPVRFRQILFNLVGNAIKFTERGSVTMRCSLADRDHNPMLKIEVEDTGIGFKPGEVSKLFEQFTQVDTSPTRRKGGSGLGLFISRRIVELLGGNLSAQSKFGEGSTFTMTLPTGDLSDATMIDPNAQLAKIASSNQVSNAKAELSGRVLVVEDTKGIQLLLRRMLENAGATVNVADDGQAALDLFTDSTSNGSSTKGSPEAAPTNGEVIIPGYDLVILDMHMPRLSGYDTAAAIRKLGITTPIIALTASAMRGDREKCLNAGCDDYLTKPIDRQKLMEKVTMLMS